MWLQGELKFILLSFVPVRGPQLGQVGCGPGSTLVTLFAASHSNSSSCREVTRVSLWGRFNLVWEALLPEVLRGTRYLRTPLNHSSCYYDPQCDPGAACVLEIGCIDFCPMLHVAWLSERHWGERRQEPIEDRVEYFYVAALEGMQNLPQIFPLSSDLTQCLRFHYERQSKFRARGTCRDTNTLDSGRWVHWDPLWASGFLRSHREVMAAFSAL